MKNKICIIGFGYVGLPLALKLSETYEVIGFDINEERIFNLNKGIDLKNDNSNNANSFNV